MRTIFVAFLCGMFLFVACDSSTIRQLEQIEALIPYETDSAACMLETISFSTHFSSKEQALYNLLQTQLYYLKDSTFSSDSIISSAVSYYEEKEDRTKLMKAYYLKGCVAYQLQEIPKAQHCFLNALEISEKVKQPDPALLARIYNRCGDLYVRNNAYEEALAMNMKSLDCFDEIADPYALSYIYRDIARAYELLEKTDSVVFYYEKSNFMAELNEDEGMYYSGLLELSGFLIDNGIVDSLVTINMNKIKAEFDELPSNVCLTFGQYYKKIAKIDSAIYYLEKGVESENLYTKAASLHELSQIKKDQGDVIVALNFLEEYTCLEQEIIDMSRTELIVRTQAEYNYEKTERENLRLRLENYKNSIDLYRIAGVALFAIVVIYYLLRIKIRQIKRQRENNRKLKQEKEEIEHLYQYTLLEIEKNEKEIKRLTQIVEENTQLPKSKLREVKKQLQSLQSEQRSNQSTLNLLGSKIRESAVFIKFYQVGSGQIVEITDSDWTSLQTLIETAYPDFLSRLFSNYSPSQKEIRLCLLLKTGLSVTAIADLLCCTISSVSVTRSRLHIKITGKRGSPQDLDTYVGSL
ncbi:tetratricopeptide repeat protein [Massilibacteroides vaginae]|uniref:tetratricopeptide repeat protein n=1 Tax=Massilibacteroides vaginae TaxID=1673718 RepID=UPI000A1CE71C|nr:tetratricopeptide repeat protein [Massilibacteroides vaginae]